MEQHKIINIVKQDIGHKVILDTEYDRVPDFVYVYGMNDIQVGDNFYILKDKYGYDLAYVCRDNLWLKRIPYARNDFAVNTFADNFKSFRQFSLERWRYERALKRAVKKMGMAPTTDAASNLRLWMSKRVIMK